MMERKCKIGLKFMKSFVLSNIGLRMQTHFNAILQHSILLLSILALT